MRTKIWRTNKGREAKVARQTRQAERDRPLCEEGTGRATLTPFYSLLQVKTLFQGLDSTGDGAINLEEFSKLVKSDKLAFWMSQLELEYHDLLQLFEPLGALKGEGNPPVRFLDNGDGQAGAFRVPRSLKRDST